MSDGDIGTVLQEQVIRAIGNKTALRIRAGGTKDFLGRTTSGETLDISSHAGIINYEPTELVITACGGTTLHSIEKVLNENQQMLAFEPPYFGDNATLGGTVACNLSGPRRPYAGAARDYVLGTRIIKSKNKLMFFLRRKNHFGGYHWLRIHRL